MSAAVSVEIIKNAILDGIKEAWEDYYKASNGEWLWNAPEYFITVKIRDAILKKCTQDTSKKIFITLEDNVKYILTESNSKGRGKIPNDIRKDGRFDIVLWWASSYPRCIIEVKNRYNKKQIYSDLERICKTLNKSQKSEDSSLQFGVFAFYTDSYSEQGKSSDIVARRIDNIYTEAKKIAHREKIQVNYYYLLKPVKKEQSSWGVAVYIFKKGK